MMRFSDKPGNMWIIVALLLTAHTLNAQHDTASFLKERDSLLSDYSVFKEHMKERTWLNVVNMNLKADKVIEADSKVIGNLLLRDVELEKAAVKEAEQHHAEKEALKNRIGALEQEATSHRQRWITFLLAGAALVVVFLILAVAFVMRQKTARFKREKAETHAAGLEKEIMLLQENITSKEELLRTIEARYTAEKAATETRLATAEQHYRQLETEHTDMLQRMDALEKHNLELRKVVTSETEIREEVERKISALIDNLKKNLA
jgi:DNA repair exonuclease SbcCD ATPase subunit